MLGKFYQQLGLLCTVMYILLKLSSYTCVSFIELDEVARVFLLLFKDLEIKLHDHFVVKDGRRIFYHVIIIFFGNPNFDMPFFS
jgi:hypothetical protein